MKIRFQNSVLHGRKFALYYSLANRGQVMILKWNRLTLIVIFSLLSMSSTSSSSVRCENFYSRNPHPRISLANSNTAKLINTMLIRKPVDLRSMTNEYQEVVDFKDLGDSIKVTIKYDLLTSYNPQIRQNKDWQKDYQNMREYLEPGKTADWDPQMRSDLLAELKQVGIDPNVLTDKEVVEQVSSWIFSKFSYDSFFIPYFVSFKSGESKVLTSAESVFKATMTQNNVTSVQQAFKRGLSGKNMYYNRTHGDCTASAILMSTVMRALGIPTRIVLTIPGVDALDINQMTALSKILGISIEEKNLMIGIESISAQAANFKNGAFIAHTFNEVYIGNEWVKLNYNNLGQGNIWTSMGLMTQINTFRDWADAYPVVESWGAKFAQEITEGKISNPYRSIAIEKLEKK